MLEPGTGDDTAFMLEGDDRFIWNPGDGNDIVSGGGGVDTLESTAAEDVEPSRSRAMITASSCCATSARSDDVDRGRTIELKRSAGTT